MDRNSVRWVQLAIVSCAVLVYLLGNGQVQLWDRDEPRYAQTSRQMLASGDWVVPRFLDTVRTAKPILIYWAQAACMAVLGDNAFAARLPSVIGVSLTLVLLMKCVTRACGVRRGLATALIFATSGMTIAAAKMCMTDGVLLLFVTVAQLCVFTLWYNGLRGGPVVLLGLALGLAGLTKGPVVLGIVASTLVAAWLLGLRARPHATLGGQVEQFPIIAGIAVGIMTLVVGPWLFLIQERAPEFLSTAIGHDVINRMRSGQEGHSGPPGFYLLTVWGTFFPWSLLLPATLVHAWKRRHLPVVRFALAAVVGPWVMFELIATKLPHYVLPTFPFLAFLTADMLVRALRGKVPDLQTRGFRMAAVAWGAIVVVIGLAAPAGLLLTSQWSVALIVGAVAAPAIAVAMAWLTTRAFFTGKPASAAIAMGGGMLALVAAIYTLYLPRYAPLRVSQQLADILRANNGYGARGYMIDYKEPSLAFHAGGGLVEQRDDNYLADADPRTAPQWVVITERLWEQQTEKTMNAWSVVGRVEGIAYNEGGHQGVVVLKNNSLR